MPISTRSAGRARTSTRRPPRALGVAAVASWTICVGAAITVLVVTNSPDRLVAVVALALVGAIVGTVWMNGLRTVAILAAYPSLVRRDRLSPRRTAPPGREPLRVALLCCVADDFDPSALQESMQQTHTSTTTFILDDSASSAKRAEVDLFAETHGARIVRRADRRGYKAGNLNHFLATQPAFDAYVIVDSDEALAPDFVDRALSRLSDEQRTHRVGVVQGHHKTRRGRSGFADEFGPMFETHVAVTQRVRSTYGFSFFMGRGALITAECIEAAGGFPEVVAEDIAFSVDAQLAGYEIIFAPELVSVEDYAIDYHAFRVQHGKYVQGATEFVRQYGARILRSDLSLARKSDLLLDALVTPLGGWLAIGMFVIAVLPVNESGGALMPTWMGVALGLCGIAPFLGEMLRRCRSGNIFGAARFLARALRLYSSLVVHTLRSSARVVAGRRAVFAVTPKRRMAASARVCARAEIWTAGGTSLIAAGLAHSFAPALAFLVCAASAWLLARSQRRDHADLGIPQRIRRRHRERQALGGRRRAVSLRRPEPSIAE